MPTSGRSWRRPITSSREAPADEPMTLDDLTIKVFADGADVGESQD
jgi:hypothetical protein